MKHTHLGRLRRAAAIGGTLAATAATLLPAAAAAAPLSDIDLSTYVRVGRYDLPEPTRTTAPTGNLLAQEASGVAYNQDTGTLFVVGDGGTSVTQVTKTGELVDTMTLASGSSPQGTEFYDTEGITWIGGNEFVFTEERDRQLVKFTYAPGTTLTRAQTKTVKLGTTIGNVGLEGLTYDPATNGFIPVKETTPLGIFQTTIDWDAGTASNGSPTTVNSTNLFDPALTGVADYADVFALSNLTGLTGPDRDNLVIISQESGRVIEATRTGTVLSGFTIRPDLDTTISVQDQTHEGVTMDDHGTLYIVSENGGGNIDHPQLWVYRPATAPNAGPTQVALVNQTNSIIENTPTTSRIKVADVRFADDGLGTTNLGVTGPDAGAFQVDETGLYLKAGTVLDYEAKTSYSVAVTADDPAVGGAPDATSPTFTLNVGNIAVEGPSDATLAITEVASWGNNNATYAADWFELTNTGSTPADLSGFKIDDNSRAFALSVPLTGVPVLAPGESAIFVEGNASTISSYKSAWFGGNAPAGLQFGTYSGSGVGFGNGGDEVNIFDSTGARVIGVGFGAGTAGITFDNAAGAGGKTDPLPVVTTLSQAGVNGAFVATGETGSPGRIANPISLRVTEVSPWSSGNSPYGVDWFELTNTGSTPVDLTGFKVDDNSHAFGSAVALNGVPTIAPGESVLFLEDSTATRERVATFRDFWFADALPRPQVGWYTGGGVGLSTGGDEVNIYTPAGRRVAGVSFGTSTTGRTFDNAAGLNGTEDPVPAISTLSTRGTAGARTVGAETGSPGSNAPDTTKPVITFTGASASYKVDQTVAITCTATDEPRGSGLASNTCANVNRPAWEYGTGLFTITATATDYAGNSTTKTVRLKIKVDIASACTLTRRFAWQSATYKALTSAEKAQFNRDHLKVACAHLARIAPGETRAIRWKYLLKYRAEVAYMTEQGFLTADQARVLRILASRLP